MIPQLEGTMSVNLLLMILAIICFVIAALGLPTERFNLIAAGLALWATATVV